MFSGETKRMFVRWAIWFVLAIVICHIWPGLPFWTAFFVAIGAVVAIYIVYEWVAPNHFRNPQ